MEIYISMLYRQRWKERKREKEEEGTRETLEHRKRNRPDVQDGLQSVDAISKQ